MFGFRGFNDDFLGGDDMLQQFGFGNLLTDGTNRGQNGNQRQNQNRNAMMQYDPFQMFHQMESMMNQMTSIPENIQDHQNCYVQSYSYSCVNNGNGPVVVEKQYSHQKMGDVSETKAAVKDGRNKEEKMRLQRTLGDQARTVTKTRVNGGDILSDERYENIDQNEIDHFDSKWRSQAQNQLYLGQGQGRRNAPNYNRGLPAPQIPNLDSTPNQYKNERTPPKSRTTQNVPPRSRREDIPSQNPVRNSRPAQRGGRTNMRK